MFYNKKKCISSNKYKWRDFQVTFTSMTQFLQGLKQISVLLGLVCTMNAATADDLLSIYNLAMEFDPKINAATAIHQAALEAIPQSRAVLLPNLGLSADVSRDRFDPRESNEDTSFATNKTYSVELRQAIYQRERFMQLRQAGYEAAQADAVYAAEQQDLILRVAEPYFLVLGTIDNLEFVNADKQAIAVTLEQARHRYNAGLSASIDVYEAQARYDIAVSEQLNAEKLLEDAYDGLRKLTGVTPQDVKVLQAEIPLVMPEPADPESWVSTSLEQNPLLLAATEAANVAKKQIEVQRSGHYPSLDLTANYQYRDNDFGGLGIPIERNDSAVGLQLNIPFYQGGLVSSRTREASYQYVQAKEIRLERQREIERLSRESYRGVTVELSKVKALMQAILSSEKALESSQAGFQFGTRTIVDVLDSQGELLRAKRDHARSRYDYLLNTLRLKQAAGIVDVADLARINAMLQ